MPCAQAHNSPAPRRRRDPAQRCRRSSDRADGQRRHEPREQRRASEPAHRICCSQREPCAWRIANFFSILEFAMHRSVLRTTSRQRHTSLRPVRSVEMSRALAPCRTEYWRSASRRPLRHRLSPRLSRNQISAHPSGVTRTFDGLTSRCTLPAAWSAQSPSRAAEGVSRRVTSSRRSPRVRLAVACRLVDCDRFRGGGDARGKADVCLRA